MKKLILAGLFSGALCTSAFAATAVATLNVSAVINPTCSAAAVTAAFGTWDRTEKTVTTLVKLTCGSTLTTTPTVNFGGGGNLSSGVRYMKGTANTAARLRYDLLNGTTAIDTTSNVSLTATGNDYTMTLTTKIPADATAAADTYTDAVTLTFTY